MLRAEIASSLLFERKARHPYYVLTPGFDQRSAGNRILYTLVHVLNGIGEEAYVVPNAPSPALPGDVALGLRAPRLTQDLADHHHELGRTPIVVYPETFTLPENGAVSVCYILNYLGVLGKSSSVPACEVALAYSQNIAARLPCASEVLFMPVSDANFWTPKAGVERVNPCAYAGKYVEFHRQDMPMLPAGTTIITRYKEDAPDVWTLRDILRRSTACYIYENTALAIEAALCGCPVVYRTNPYFDELIAAEELGLAGFATDDTGEALALAALHVDEFRDSYARAVAAFGERLINFTEVSQAIAHRKTYDQRFIIDRIVQAVVEGLLS